MFGAAVKRKEPPLTRTAKNAERTLTDQTIILSAVAIYMLAMLTIGIFAARRRRLAINWPGPGFPFQLLASLRPLLTHKGKPIRFGDRLGVAWKKDTLLR
jgi:hypothetical protein